MGKLFWGCLIEKKNFEKTPKCIDYSQDSWHLHLLTCYLKMTQGTSCDKYTRIQDKQAVPN